MKDQFGRCIRYMRLSITDRCNLRCAYCMPEGTEMLPQERLLAPEELAAVARAAVSLGITKFRLTGGEPLVRRDCVEIVRMLRQIQGLEEICMTTNAVELQQNAAALREAGLDRLNVSLDTLDRDEFLQLTGKPFLERVLCGIDAALDCGIPVRLNTVNREKMDWERLLEYAKKRGLPVRFIEIMPIGAGRTVGGASNDRLLHRIERAFGKAAASDGIRGNGPAVYLRFPGLPMEIGFISAVSHSFCGGCNRVRLTAEGYLKPCLCYEEGLNLAELLRAGANLGEVQEQMRIQIWNKPEQHCFGRPDGISESRTMNRIGG